MAVKRFTRLVVAQGTDADGIEYDHTGRPVDDAIRAAKLKACPRCRRWKPEASYTASGWKGRGQYCKWCRVEDNRARRAQKRIEQKRFSADGASTERLGASTACELNA